MIGHYYFAYPAIDESHLYTYNFLYNNGIYILNNQEIYFLLNEYQKSEQIKMVNIRDTSFY